MAPRIKFREDQRIWPRNAREAALPNREGRRTHFGCGLLGVEPPFMGGGESKPGLAASRKEKGNTPDASKRKKQKTEGLILVTL